MANGGNIKFGIDFQTNKAGLNEVSNGLQNIMTQIQAITKSNNMDEEFKKAAEEAKKLESIISGSWNDKLGQLNLDKLNQGIKDAYGSVSGLRTSLEGAGTAGHTAFNALATQVLNTNIQLKESKSLLDEMAETMANTVKWGISSSIFNNITSAIQQSFYYAKDLDRQLTNIRIVTGDSAEQMERFAKVANQTAKDLGRSTLDYTKAATSFYQQGLGDEQVAARSRLTLMAQNITGAGSQMVDYLTSVWNGFQVGIEDAESYVDKLAKVADSSASDMNELAKAMSKVSATANLVGVDVDQLNAILATVIATTRQAPEAVGTAFKTVFTRINDIKTGAEDAEISLGNYSSKMASLGFNVLDANGRLRDTGQVLEQIGSRWETLSKEQQVYLAQIMGGQRQITQVSALFQNWGMYTDLLNDSLNSEGALLQKNNIYLESTAAHMEKLGAEKERTADILFDAETVNTFVDALDGALKVQAEAAEKVLAVQKGLTVEQQKQAVQIQKKIGLTQQVIDNLQKQQKNANDIVEKLKEKEIIQGKSIALLQQESKQLTFSYEATQKSLVTMEKMEGSFSKISSGTLDWGKHWSLQLDLLDQVEKEQDNLMSIWIDSQKSEKDFIKNINIIKQGISDSNTTSEDFKTAWKEISTVTQTYANQQKTDLSTIDTYLKNQKVDTAGLTEENKQLLAVLLKQNEAQAQQGRHVIDLQNKVRALSAVGQALTTIGGALASGLAEGATASEKLNATWSGINGTIGACLTLLGPFGPALSMIWGGVSSIGKAILEATGLWEKWQDHFKSTEQKIGEIKQKFRQATKIEGDYSKQRAEISSIADEFERLAKKKDSHIQLTQEEQNRYHDLVDTITQYNEDAIKGYDLKGQKIVKNNGLIEETLGLLDEEYEKQMRNLYGGANANSLKTYYNDRLNNARQQNQRVNDSNTDLVSESQSGGKVNDFINNVTSEQLETIVRFLEYSTGNDFQDLREKSSDLIGLLSAENKDMNAISTLASEIYNTITGEGISEKQWEKNIPNYKYFFTAFKDLSETSQNIEEEIKIAKQNAEDALEEAKDIPMDEIFKILKWDSENGNNSGYQQVKKQWGKDFETYGQDFVDTALLSFLNSYKNEIDWSSQTVIEDIIAAGNEFLENLEKVNGASINKAREKIKNLNSQIDKLTIEEYEQRKRAIAEELVRINKESLTTDNEDANRQTEEYLESILGFDITLNKNGQLDTLESSFDRLKQILLDNMVSDSFGYQFVNSDQFKSYIDGLDLTQQQFMTLMESIQASGQEITSLPQLKKYIEDFFKSAENDDIIANIDKIKSAIKNLYDDKDLKPKEREELIANLGLSEQDLINSETALEKLKEKLINLYDDVKEGEQGATTKINNRRQALAAIYQDLETLNKDKEKLQPGDYETVWREVFQKQLEALGMDIDALKRYADAKGIAFDKNNVDQAVWEEVLNLKKHEQQVDQLTSKYEKLKDVKIKDGELPKDLDQLWQLLQKITGQDISYTWLIDNLELIGTIIENNKNNVEGLVQALTNLASGKAFQQGNNLAGLDAEQVNRSQTITAASAGFQSLQSTGTATKEQKQAIDELAESNDKLADSIKKNGYEHQKTLFYLQQELQIQQQIYDFYNSYLTKSATLTSNLQGLRTQLLKSTQGQLQEQKKGLENQKELLQNEQKLLQTREFAIRFEEEREKNLLKIKQDTLQSELQTAKLRVQDTDKDLRKTENLHDKGLVTDTTLYKNQDAYNQAVQKAVQIQRQLFDINAQLSEKDKEILETEEKLINLRESQKSDQEKLKNQQKQLKNQYDQLKNQQQSLQNDKSKILMDETLLKTQAERLQSEIESKNNQQEILQTRIQRAGIESSIQGGLIKNQTEETNLQREFNQLEEEKQQLQNQYLDIQGQITEKQKEYAELNNQIEQNQNNQLSLVTQISQVQDESIQREIQQENQSLSLKKQIAQIDELIKESEQTSDQSIQRLQAQKENLQLGIQETSLYEERIDLQQRLADTQERINQIKEDQSKSIAQLKEQQQQQNALMQQAAEGSQEEIDAKIRLAEIEDMLLQKQYERFQMEEELRQAREKLDSDVDEDEYINLTEHIQEAATASAELADQLQNNQGAAEDVAESLLRYDSALEQVQDKMQDWEKQLNQTNLTLQEQAQLCEELGNVYADLLDVPDNVLSDEFLTSADNLNLLKQAANGAEWAYDALRQAAFEDIIGHAGLDLADFYNEQGAFYDQYNSLKTNLEQYPIGATLSLDDTQALQALANMLYNAGMTTDQIAGLFETMGANVSLAVGTASDEMNDSLGSVGADVEVKEDTKQDTQQNQATSYDVIVAQKPGAYEYHLPEGDPENLTIRDYTGYNYYPYPNYVPRKEQTQNKKQSKNYAVKVTSATKSTGGNFKFSNSNHGAGTAGQAARTPTPPKTSTPSSRTPSSRTPSSRTPSTRTPSSRTSSTPSEKPEKIKDPQTMELLQEQRDRYHDIDIQIKNISEDLKRLQKQQSKLTGKDLIANLNKQLEVLQKQTKAQKEKLSIAQTQAEQIRKALTGEGVNFAEDGTISNYNQILDQKLAGVNALIAHYNTLTAAEQEEFKAVVEAAKKDYQNFKKQMQRYDTLVSDTIPDLQDTIEDSINEQIEIQIQKFKIQVELSLDTAEAERKFNKFKKKVLDKISDEDIIGNINSLFGDLSTYYKDGFGVIQALTDQVNNTMYEINQIKTKGYSDIYGDNLKQAEEDLKKYTEQLMSNLEDVQDIIDEIHNSIFDAIDAADEAFDEQIDKLQHINDLIDHGKNLIELLYGDEAFDKMSEYYGFQQQNNLKNLNLQRGIVEMWRQEADNQRKIRDSFAKDSKEWKEADKILKEYQGKWQDASDSFNSLLEDSIKNIIDRYSNGINKLFSEFQKKLTNNTSFDRISEEWQLMEKYADLYLDKVNAAYEIQKLESAYKQAIDDNTGNLAAQKSLNGLMEQQLKYLKDKQNLTQYDIDKANALLQIEIKRLALEQVRASKTKLRLRRDSQGNYTYQYTSDEQQLDKAKDELAKAKNDLWNLTIKENEKQAKDSFSLIKEYMGKIKEVYEDTTLSEEQRAARIAQINSRYGKVINGIFAENQIVRQDLANQTFGFLGELYGMDVGAFENMAQAQQDILLNSIVPFWGTGIHNMMDLIQGEGGLESVTQGLFDGLESNVQDFNMQLGELELAAGVCFDNITGHIQDSISYTEGLLSDNQELIDSYKDLIKTVQDLINKLDVMIQKFGGVTTSATTAVEAANGLRESPTQSTYSSSNTSNTTSSSASSSSSSGINSDVYLTSGSGGSSSSGSSSTSSGSQVGLIQTSSQYSAALGPDLFSVGLQETRVGLAHEDPLEVGILGLGPAIRTPKTSASYSGQSNIKKKKIQSFGTGGYTGNWESLEGRLAFLDKKELVLNKQDTENILSAAEIVRTMDNLLLNLNDMQQSFNRTKINNILSDTNNRGYLRQHVTIDAHFPNVTNHNEIEKAFKNLVNMASQYAYSNRM